MAERLSPSRQPSKQANPRPKEKKKASKDKSLRVESKKVDCDPGNCYCKSKKGGSVIQCDICRRHCCHPSCVGISDEILNAIEDDIQYICPLCILKKFTNEEDNKKDSTDRTTID